MEMEDEEAAVASALEDEEDGEAVLAILYKQYIYTLLYSAVVVWLLVAV